MIKTAIDMYEGLLFNLNKVKAPAIFVDDFIHYVNMAISQHRNKRYNMYDSSQQLTDDLQVLAVNIKIDENGLVLNNKGQTINLFNNNSNNNSNKVITDLGVEFDLPSNYTHILNCISKIQDGTNKCDGSDKIIETRAKRLTADNYAFILDNSFHKPKVNRPYFYLRDNKIEIRFGKKGTLKEISIDYLREPVKVSLTQAEINEKVSTGVDNSQILEFNEYTNYEILRELTTLVLDHNSDPRIQITPSVTQSIP